ncbi:MAG: aspartate carbamoyltransferase catalytic subunit [Nitrospirae bacterium]|nr:aspartate carbamoyltransferase catalytic subunit [Nitrospirota bacterium]MBI3394179.1 aspartate carbamoyltransferase catalytic subunit [Nitrospirota bacterium]
MSFRGPHLLGIRGLSRGDIEEILDSAGTFRAVLDRDIKKVPTLRGKTIVNLFFEPSTRTRTSFELAGKRLSADVVNFSQSTSSVVKGETLIDTARTIEAMPAEILVIRHPCSGAAELLARSVSASVINAGDGMHEHPTQALLDLYTVREALGRVEGLRVAIVGDVLHSRVARSDILAFKTMGASVVVCGPPTILPPGLAEWGVDVTLRIAEALEGADVVIALRMQMERQNAGFVPSLNEYAALYGLTRERLDAAGGRMVVMHPGPINRGVEIAPDVADSASSLILNQVANGMAVRMAVLYLVAGGASA